MASRFWVGGTGTWDASTTTHWAATTGGAGGATVPTSADDVTFDSNSGATATVTINGGGTANSITINKSDLTLTHTTGSTVTAAVTLTTGTLNTNGQTCAWGSFSAAGSATRVLTLGASAITLSSGGTAFNWGSTTGLTLSSNTSVITFTGSTAGTNPGGGTNGNGMSLVFSGSGTANMNGPGSNITFANITRTGTTNKGDLFQISSPVTVTGTLTLNSNSDVNRVLVESNVAGTPRTITAANLVASNTVDFMDITGAGAATWTTAASGANHFGDAKGNSGITFDTPRTLFGVVAGNFSSTATWSLTTGGSGGQNPPLPQDTVKLDANSAAGIYVTDMPRIGKDLDCTGFIRTLNFSSTANTMYGSLTLGSGMTVGGGTQSLVLAGRSSHTLTFAGKTLTNNPVTLGGSGGTYTLQDNMSISAGFSSNGAAFNANNNNVSISRLNPSTGNITMGSGTWTVNGTATFWDGTGAGTINCGTSTIVVSDTSASLKAFAGGGKTYSTLKHTATGSGTLQILGNNTFSVLDLECTTARTITLPASGTQAVTGSLTLTGASGQLLSVVSSSPGTATTVNCAWSSAYTHSNTSLSGDIVINQSNTLNVDGLAAPGDATVLNLPRTSIKNWMGIN